METNIIGELNNLKERDIKPNFSELSRQYGLHRHTIKKYWDEGGKIIKSRNKPSVLDKYKEEIEEILQAEINNHLGYEKYGHGDKENYRNGYKEKKVQSNYGDLEIAVPQDRNLDYSQVNRHENTKIS